MIGGFINLSVDKESKNQALTLGYEMTAPLGVSITGKSFSEYVDLEFSTSTFVISIAPKILYDVVT